MNWRRMVPWVHLLAFWPLAGWYGRRMLDRGDEPWGLLALATAAVFLWRERHRGTEELDRRPPPERALPSLLPAALVTVAYAVAYRLAPPLVCAGLAMTALAFSLSACWLGQRLHSGLWGLLVLSLPVMLSFEYYAGYPLRLAVSWSAAKLLSLSGLAVRPAGTQLEWNGLQVAVDAPCAGIRLLWVGAWLTLTLGCLYRLGTRRLLGAGLAAFLLVMAGNIARTAALFLVESGIVAGPAWLHPAVGVVAFAVVAAGVAVMMPWL